MPRTNYTFNGFVFHKMLNGSVVAPDPIPCHVADNYATALYPGDPVGWVNDGTVARTAAGTGAGIFGVVVDILQYRNSDGVLVRNGRSIPANTRWTADADRSMVMVLPAQGCLFRVQADDAVTITSLSAARALVGENCDHGYSVATASAALGIGSCLLDVSTRGTGNTLQWRVFDLLEAPGNDATVTRATYLVYANVLSNWGAPTSATGV